jgi:predicted permease
MRSLYLKLCALWKRRQLERDLQDELAYHHELRGKSASVPFGNQTSIKEELHDVWTFTWFENLWNDVRQASRGLLRSPGHSSAIVLLLGVGIGASAAVFSLVNAVLVRDLPVEKPGELAIVQRMDSPGTDWSMPMYEEFVKRQTSFSGVLASQTLREPKLMLQRNDTEEVNGVTGSIVSGNYFHVLGIKAQLGRVLADQDDGFENPNPVMVLSHDFWRRQFAEDQGVIGREVFLFGRAFTIIGVVPREFRGVGGDFWVPLNMQPVVVPGDDRRRSSGSSWLYLMGRLKPGISMDRAQAEANVIYKPIRATTNQKDSTLIQLVEGRRGFDYFRSQYGTPLQILFGAVGMLLLIACANVASLLLARAGVRRKETALRQALGCGRWRLVRQFLIESALLAGAGGVLGLVLAISGARELVLLAAPAAAQSMDVSMDRTVLLFTLAASILSVLVFGLAPAIRASRVSFDAVLKSNSRSATAARQPMNRFIVSGQTALCVVLVTGSALFGQSLYALYHTDAGFKREQVITATVNARALGFGQQDNRYSLLADRLIERLSAVPGVRSVSVAAAGFLTGAARGLTGIVVDGQPVQGILRINQVSDEFFGSLGIRLLEGRTFDSRDRAGAPRAAVVNQAFARTYFPGAGAIGKRFWKADDVSDSSEIVGVVQDSKYNDVREATVPLVFFALEQFPQRFNHVQLKVDGSAASLVTQVTRAILEVDPRLRPANVETLDQSLDRVVARDILLARLSGLFGGIALLLACFGIYGMISYAVSARTAEIGIRMALGAQPGEVRSHIIGDALKVVAPGIVIGLVAAFGAARYVESFLFGVKGQDPMTYGIVAAGLVAAAALAAYLPSRRASRIDPVIALRCE